MEIIRKKDQLINKWSGGETRQLYIYPPESSLQNRDFFFRLSTATIEIEKSTFTPMPGYFRTLTVLYGELELHHKDQHAAKLKPFESDDFLGDWETTCIGKGTDFNAIGNDQYTCFVSAYNQWESYSSGEWFEIKGSGLTSSFCTCLYLHKGSIELRNKNSTTLINEGDIVCISQKELSESVFEFRVIGNPVLIEVRVDKLFD